MELVGHTAPDMLTFAIIFVLVFLPISYMHMKGVNPVEMLWKALTGHE